MTSSDPVPSTRTVLITGATSGLGEETARVLASGVLGPHTVILASRNATKIASTIANLVAAYPDAATRLHGLAVDVGSLASVAEAVEELGRMEREKGVRVDTLVENAGITGPEKKTLKEGIETTFVTNHVGHYLLEKMMLPRMVRNAGARGVKPRVVIVSSGTHDPTNHTPLPTPQYAPRDWINPTTYTPLQAYTNSKLANALHGNDLAASHPSVSVATYCPGFLTDTQLGFDNAVARFAFVAGVRGWLNFAAWWYGIPDQVSWVERSGRFLARLAVEEALGEESGVFWMVEGRHRTSGVANEREKQVEVREVTEGVLRERGYRWEEVV
ncbi:hypothetical protein HDU96_007673 [Phlyctochytrium bullatum]|nr:hypothetical protein HDU96_007673 [Phlyctochytrium bullatum]